MLPKGPAKKVTIYVNEDTRYHAGPLWSAVFEFLQHKRVSGATVLRPIEGFGSHHHTHSFRMEATMEHMPIRIEFVDTAERVQRGSAESLRHGPRRPHRGPGHDDHTRRERGRC